MIKLQGFLFFSVKQSRNSTNMAKRKLTTLLLIVFICSTSFLSFGQNYFEFTNLATDAYEKAISLRFDEAKIAISKLKTAEPKNIIAYHIENYIDFFTVFINEEKDEFEKLEANKDKRLAKIRQGPKSSPYYLFSQAEIKLQWALVRLKFEEYFTAFNEVSQAYKLLQKNTELFPDFVANKKSLGILHAIIGTIPSNYKWGVRLLSGMNGTIEQGKQEVKEVLEYSESNNFIFEKETVVIYAFLIHYLSNESAKAWKVISNHDLKPKENPLACFALVNLAIRTGHNDEAISLLENRPKSPNFHSFHYLDLMLGFSKLYRLDEDADDYIKSYLINFKGQNYIKEAYQKLAWHELIRGNMDGYKKNMALCISEGKSIVDNDRQALRNAKSNFVPHPTLLKARLLFDGGYYKRAENLLKEHPLENFDTEEQQIEYVYRMARIEHRLGNVQMAKDFYNQTILMGNESPLFYACNAALQMGIIYEKSGLLIHSKYYFNYCLKIMPEEYKNGLHQQARAGLIRLKSLKS